MFPTSNPTPPFNQPGGGTAARTRQRFIITVDPRTGRQHAIPESEIETIFAPDGGIHTVERLADGYACRCDPRNPPGGSCSACGGRSCARCQRSCQTCLAPLCPAHTRVLAGAEGTAFVLCQTCFGAAMRRRIGISVVRGLLSPFVQF
jgi:hypothetical protein